MNFRLIIELAPRPGVTEHQAFLDAQELGLRIAEGNGLTVQIEAISSVVHALPTNVQQAINAQQQQPKPPATAGGN